MVPAFRQNHFLASGISTRDHHRKLRDVVAVLCEECPVGHIDGLANFFRKFDGDIADKRGAVALLSLSGGGSVDVGIVIAQIVGAVTAHIVDDSVAIDIVYVRALRVIHI